MIRPDRTTSGAPHEQCHTGSCDVAMLPLPSLRLRLAPWTRYARLAVHVPRETKRMWRQRRPDNRSEDAVIKPPEAASGACRPPQGAEVLPGSANRSPCATAPTERAATWGRLRSGPAGSRPRSLGTRAQGNQAPVARWPPPFPPRRPGRHPPEEASGAPSPRGWRAPAELPRAVGIGDSPTRGSGSPPRGHTIQPTSNTPRQGTGAATRNRTDQHEDEPVWPLARQPFHVKQGRQQGSFVWMHHRSATRPRSRPEEADGRPAAGARSMPPDTEQSPLQPRRRSEGPRRGPA